MFRGLGLSSVAESAIDSIIPPKSGSLPANFMKSAIVIFSSFSKLRVNLSSEYIIMSIKLYLRNGLHRQCQQNVRKVIVEDRNGQKHQCGGTYNQDTEEQYPTFECRNGILSRFVCLSLENTKKITVRKIPVQVCELEVFVSKIDTNYL